MSVSTPIIRSDRRRDIVADAGQTVFSFDHPVFDAVDLAVTLQVAPSSRWTEATGYTVDLVAGGATVTFAAPPRPDVGSPAVVVRLEGRRTPDRLNDVTRAGAVSGVALDRELDKVAVVEQELRRDVDDHEERLADVETLVYPDHERITSLETVLFGALPWAQNPAGYTLNVPLYLTADAIGDNGVPTLGQLRRAAPAWGIAADPALVLAGGGTVSGGGEDDTTLINALEARTDHAYVDLGGKTLTTTRNLSTLAKKYHNGELYGISIYNAPALLKPAAPVSQHAVFWDGDNGPVAEWSGKTLLWLGTSIPQQGHGTAPIDDAGSYPEQVAAALGCSVVNNAWAGSHCRYSETDIATLGVAYAKALSMTQDDVVAGLAKYGPTSGFSDSVDLVTKPSQMTADFRIRNVFASRAITHVILDHAHNDRSNPVGTMTPESRTITGVTLGAQTIVALSSIGTIAVGDCVALRVNGIVKLDYACARVQAVAGNTITLNIASSAFLGAFASGSLVKLDRTTLWGAFEAVLYQIKWAAALYDQAQPVIVMAGAPSEYTNNTLNPHVYHSARMLERLARKWGVLFFDVAQSLQITPRQHTLYFPDTVHPTTPEARRAISAHWVKWLNGGATRQYSPNSFLKRDAARSPLVDSLPPVYDALGGGFVTTNTSQGPPVTVLSENWAAGLAAYTLGGTAPTIVAAPWDPSKLALRASAAANIASSAKLSALTLSGGTVAEFTLYMPQVAGLTGTATVKTVSLMSIQSAPAYLSVQIIIRPSSSTLRAHVFQQPNASSLTATASVPLQAGVAHRVKLESRRQTSASPGALVLYLDGALVAGPIVPADSTQPTPSILQMGILSSNTGSPLELYIADVLLQKRALQTLFTGSFTAQDGTVLTVANGRIVTEV